MAAKVIREEVVRGYCDPCMWFGEWTYEDSEALSDVEHHNRIHHADTGGTNECICPRFSDTGGFRIADLCCPVHGTNGTNPGDGPWEEE